MEYLLQDCVEGLPPFYVERPPQKLCGRYTSYLIILLTLKTILENRTFSTHTLRCSVTELTSHLLSDLSCTDVVSSCFQTSFFFLDFCSSFSLSLGQGCILYPELSGLTKNTLNRGADPFSDLSGLTPLLPSPMTSKAFHARACCRSSSCPKFQLRYRAGRQTDGRRRGVGLVIMVSNSLSATVLQNDTNQMTYSISCHVHITLTSQRRNMHIFLV